jgi:DNA-binding transcriptional ArsR family regulator
LNTPKPDLSEMQGNACAAASLLKTLANPSRLVVLCALVEREHTAGELAELGGTSQSAVSQHLARLRAEEVVATRREGQVIYYSLKDDSTRKIIETLHGIYCGEAGNGSS